METILLIAVISTLNIVCFFIGAKVGQKVVKGEEIKAPTLNPMTIYNEHQEKKEVEKEKDKLDKILKNIDKYDGTEAGQEDIE
jgi:hypothetical protein